MKFRVIFSVLAMLLSSHGCSSEQAPREASASVSSLSHLSLLPAQTSLVVYANFEAMRQTPFGKELSGEFADKKAEWEHDSDYLEFLETTGLDPQKDIYEIWISSLGRKDDYDNRDDGGVIIRGSFDQGRIHKYVKRENRYRMRQEAHKGYEVYIIEDRQDEEFAYAFLNSETVVLGRERWLKSVLDLSKNDGENVLSNPVMADYIRDIPRKEHFWGILNINELTDRWAEEIRRHGSSFKGTESLEKMKSFMFYTHLDQKADVNLKGIFATEEEAELFADMLKGFKAMAKMLVSDDREAIDMLNDIKIRNRGNTINISGQIDKDFFEKVEEKRKGFSGREFKLL